jgi:transposase
MVDRCKSRLGPAPDLPDRMFFEAVLYWARTGVPWRDLPSDFGDWSAVYNRLRRWIASGRLKRLFEAMAAQPACEGTLPGDDRLDDRRGPPALRRGLEKKGGAAAQAIGRSRGGPSTKVIAVVTTRTG